MISRNKSFIVVKPDDEMEKTTNMLKDILSTYAICIDSVQYFHFTEHIIQELWPHRKKRNISSIVMNSLLQHSSSALLLVHGKYFPYRSLTDKLADNKGNTFSRTRDANSIRARMHAGEKHFNGVHIADNHKNIEKELKIIETAGLTNFYSHPNKIQIDHTGQEIDYISLLSTSKDLSTKVKDALKSGKSISECDLEIVFSYWEPHVNLKIIRLANDMIDESYF